MGFINTYYKLPKNTITEVFRAASLKKVYALIEEYFMKKFGEIHRWGHEHVVNSKGEFNGYRYSIKGQFIRFNWHGENNARIDSIDIWSPDGGKKPAIHLDVSKWSVVKILPIIADIIRNPEVPADITNESIISEAVITYNGNEYRTMNQAIAAMVNDGMGSSQIAKELNTDERNVIGRIKGIFRASEGTKETVSSDSEESAERQVNAVKKKAEEGQYSSIKAVREDMPALVRMAGRPASKVNSLVICGGAGSGKCVFGDVLIEIIE